MQFSMFCIILASILLHQSEMIYRTLILSAFWSLEAGLAGLNEFLDQIEAVFAQKNGLLTAKVAAGLISSTHNEQPPQHFDLSDY